MLQGVLDAAGAGEVLVAGQGIREGIIRRVALPSLPPPPDVRRASLRSIARRFARWDEERALHRAATAAMLQSELDPSMTPELRELLGHAAYVLDIGTAIDYYNRHRQTAAILAVTDLNGFSHRHTALIAALIRTAEKPNPGVRPYRPLLTKADAPALERAALILAIADELGRRVVPDRHPHVSCVVEPGCVRLTTQGDARRQLSRLSGRFREAFGRALDRRRDAGLRRRAGPPQRSSARSSRGGRNQSSTPDPGAGWPAVSIRAAPPLRQSIAQPGAPVSSAASALSVGSCPTIAIRSGTAPPASVRAAIARKACAAVTAGDSDSSASGVGQPAPSDSIPAVCQARVAGLDSTRSMSGAARPSPRAARSNRTRPRSLSGRSRSSGQRRASRSSAIACRTR